MSVDREDEPRIIRVADCNCGKSYVQNCHIFVCSCGTQTVTKPFIALEDVGTYLERQQVNG